MSIAETVVEDAAKSAVGGGATMSMLPWILLGLVVVFIGAMTAAFFEGKHIETTVFEKYVSDQKAAAEAQVAANKAALLTQALQQQAAMDVIKNTHAGALNEITQRRDALITANRNLTQRLYVATASSSVKSADLHSAGSSGPGDNETGTAALSIGSSEFFLDEFAQADSDIATITALQQVVTEDRLVCNGSLPGVSPPSASPAAVASPAQAQSSATPSAQPAPVDSTSK